MSMDHGGRITPSGSVLWAIVAITTVVIASVTVLIWAGKDPTVLVGIVGVTLGPTIASLVALIKVDRTETKMDNVTEHIASLTPEEPDGPSES
jgi:uncharacterized membrane protein